MNLQKVTGKAFVCTCVRCCVKGFTDSKDFYADLEGEPFKDYYCSQCKAQIVVIEGVSNGSK